MARLTKEEWQVARERWEGSDISHEALALEIGVSQQAVSGQAKRNNWVRRNVVDVVKNVVDVVKNVVDVVKNVVDVVTTESKNNETLAECGIDDVVEDVVNVVKSSKGGRPTKYKNEYCQQIIDYFSNNDAYEILEHREDKTRKKAFLNRPLTMAGFAQTIGVDRATLERWASERDENGALAKPDFCRSYRAALTMQEKMIAEGGMTGIYNANIAKLMLTNHHGYVDATVNKNEVYIPKETEEQLNRLYDLKMSKTKDVQDALEGRFERIVGEIK